MGNPKKILQFSLSESITGIETFLRNLYKQYDHDEIQFDFVTTYRFPVYSDEFEKGGSEIFRVPSAKRFVSNYFKLKKIIKNNHYDVVHINKNSGADIIPFMVCKRLRVPTVIAHAHNTKSTVGFFADLLSCVNRRFISKSATVTLANSEEAARWMFGDKYCDTHEVPVLKNGIDLNDFTFGNEKRDEIRNRLTLSNKFVIGHVGKFNARKNHDFLIDIFKEIHTLRDDAVLMLVGTGPLMAGIQQKVHNLGLSDSVIFMGEQKNINSYYQAMDAFIMPSLKEDLPVAAIEAQAAALPVFLSDTIDRDIEVTDNVKWLSLQQSAPIWADITVNVCSCFERKLQDDALRKAGYDISEIAQRLKNVYCTEK